MATLIPKQDSVAILVVEDEVLVRMSTMMAFADEGFEVLEAAHAGEAIEILELQFDVINVVFSDVQMPGTIDGVGLAHHARLHWPRIALIVTSARPLNLIGVLPAGVRFVPKPYDVEHVAQHVRELVAG